MNYILKGFITGNCNFPVIPKTMRTFSLRVQCLERSTFSLSTEKDSIRVLTPGRRILLSSAIRTSPCRTSIKRCLNSGQLSRTQPGSSLVRTHPVCSAIQHLHTAPTLSSSSEPLSKNCVAPSSAAEQQQHHHQRGVHRESMSGMSGSQTPTPSNVFSMENKQRIMTNLSKSTLRRFYTRDVKERGAVLVPLCSVNQEPCVLFTLRSRTLNIHSGEVSFPGGRMDATDCDVSHTALREMEEELGIDAGTVEVWGHLSPVGRKDITVVPVIGYLGELDMEKIKFNTDEVAAVFVMTLSHLCSPENHAYTTFEPHQSSGQPIFTLPVFVGGEHRVWGMTAFVLDEALQVIVPAHYQSLIRRVKQEQTAS